MTTIHSHPVSHLVSEIKSTFGSMNTLVTDLKFVRTRMSLFIQTLQESKTPFVVKDDLDQAFVEVLEMLPSASIWTGKVQYTEMMSKRVRSVQAQEEHHHFMSVLPCFDDPGFCPPMGFQDVTAQGDRYPVFMHPVYKMVLEVDYQAPDLRKRVEMGMVYRRFRLDALDASGKQRYRFFETDSFNDLCVLVDALTGGSERSLSDLALLAWMKFCIIRSTKEQASITESFASVLRAIPDFLEASYAVSGSWREVHFATQAIANWLPSLVARGGDVLGKRSNFH